MPEGRARRLEAEPGPGGMATLPTPKGGGLRNNRRFCFEGCFYFCTDFLYNFNTDTVGWEP